MKENTLCVTSSPPFLIGPVRSFHMPGNAKRGRSSGGSKACQCHVAGLLPVGSQYELAGTRQRRCRTNPSRTCSPSRYRFSRFERDRGLVAEAVSQSPNHDFKGPLAVFGDADDRRLIAGKIAACGSNCTVPFSARPNRIITAGRCLKQV